MAGRIPNVHVGDEALLIGRQGGDEITAEEVAGGLEAVNREGVSEILARAPRVVRGRPMSESVRDLLVRGERPLKGIRRWLFRLRYGEQEPETGLL